MTDLHNTGALLHKTEERVRKLSALKGSIRLEGRSGVRSGLAPLPSVECKGHAWRMATYAARAYFDLPIFGDLK